MTITAPICPIASLAKPITSGKMVPPNSPIIIRPDISFCWLFFVSNACEKQMGNTFELPKPISAIATYSKFCDCDIANMPIEIIINTTLAIKNERSEI